MDVEVRHKPQAPHSGERFAWIRLGEPTWLHVTEDGYSGVKEVGPALQYVPQAFVDERRRL